MKTKIAVLVVGLFLLTACPHPPPPPPPPPVVHSLTLMWIAVIGTIKGYDILIGTAPGGEVTTPANPTPVAVPSFITTKVIAGVKYYCVVEVVALNGKLGPKSAEVGVTIP